MPKTPYPNYTLPRQVLLDLTRAVLLGGRCSFHEHGTRLMTCVHPPLRVLGTENVPRSGPGVITVNHYTRPGFWAPWFAAAVSACVPVEVYWTMTDALTFPGLRFSRFRRWLSTQLLRRLANVYSFNTMPPMPPASNEIVNRAVSIMRLVAHVRDHPDRLVGLAPEGGDQPGGILALPPAGFGKLALLFARRGMPFFPVGVYEADGCLTVCFGPAYHLTISEISDRTLADRLARQQVMQAIATCLPEWLCGEF